MTVLDDADLTTALGIVCDEDRGSLPYALVHGESLVACAAWALGEAGVSLHDLTTPWDDVRTADLPLVLHDARCPLTPPEFVADCVRRADEEDRVVAGVRPVTDTVKVVRDGVVGETVDRDALATVASPVVLPATVVRELDGPPGSDLVALVHRLAGPAQVELVEAPPQGRRVDSQQDIEVLEALTRPE